MSTHSICCPFTEAFVLCELIPQSAKASVNGQKGGMSIAVLATELRPQ